jgi:hypothetical protein
LLECSAVTCAPCAHVFGVFLAVPLAIFKSYGIPSARRVRMFSASSWLWPWPHQELLLDRRDRPLPAGWSTSWVSRRTAVGFPADSSSRGPSERSPGGRRRKG